MFELTTLIAIAPLFAAWVSTGDGVFVWLMGGVYLLHLLKKIFFAKIR